MGIRTANDCSLSPIRSPAKVRLSQHANFDGNLQAQAQAHGQVRRAEFRFALQREIPNSEDLYYIDIHDKGVAGIDQGRRRAGHSLWW